MDVGSLVVRLNMDGADFHRNVGKAREGLKDLSGEATKSNAQLRALSGLGVRGLGDAIGTIAPAAAGAEFAIGSLIRTAMTAGPVLLLLGKVAIAIGVAVLAYKGLKAVLDATDPSRGVEKLQADAHAQELFWIRSSAIHRREQRARSQAEAEELAKRRAEREKFDLGLLVTMQAEKDAQIKTWQDETTALIGQYKVRLQARQQFEAQLGAGSPTSAAAGIRKVLDMRAELEKELRNLAGMEKLGFITPRDAQGEREAIRQRMVAIGATIREEFAKIPAVGDFLNTELNKVNTGQFGAEIEKARAWVDKFVQTDRELAEGLDDIYRRLTVDVPAAVDRAGSEIKKLADDYNALAWQVYAANVQLQTNNALAGQASGSRAGQGFRNNGMTDAGGGGGGTTGGGESVDDALTRLVTTQKLPRFTKAIRRPLGLPAT